MGGTVAGTPSGVETASGRSIAETVALELPRLKADLARLVAIPSISAPDYPEATHGPLLEAYEEVATLCRDAGVTIVDPIELPHTAPVLMGEIPAPKLLYVFEGERHSIRNPRSRSLVVNWLIDTLLGKPFKSEIVRVETSGKEVHREW